MAKKQFWSTMKSLPVQKFEHWRNGFESSIGRAVRRRRGQPEPRGSNYRRIGCPFRFPLAARQLPRDGYEFMLDGALVQKAAQINDLSAGAQTINLLDESQHCPAILAAHVAPTRLI